MVAGGTEAAVSEVAVGGFAALTALSGSDDPKRASIPFDKERDGFCHWRRIRNRCFRKP